MIHIYFGLDVLLVLALDEASKVDEGGISITLRFDLIEVGRGLCQVSYGEADDEMIAGRNVGVQLPLF